MDPSNEQVGPAFQPLPIQFGFLRGMHAPAARPAQVSVADIYQAAVNRAVQDHELDKLFNPDYYDYQI